MSMNWEVFTELSTIQVQLHWVFAVISFVLAIIIFLRKKGTPSHKLIGRLYVAGMLITVISAFFVRGYGNQQTWSLFTGFSFIHLLIPYTIVMLAMSIRAIRKGDVKAHKSGMIWTFVGALIIAGAFTFIPGRHMHSLFFGEKADIQQSIESNIKH